MESSIRIFVTSRPQADLHERFTNLCRLDIWASHSDVEAYLESEINMSTKLLRNTAKYPDLKAEIIRSVTEKAAGM